MTDLQLVSLVLTLVAILGAVFYNRKSVEDMRDVLRAETKAESAVLRGEITTLRAEMNVGFAQVGATLQRVENKLDHYAEVQAKHQEDIDRLKNN